MEGREEGQLKGDLSGVWDREREIQRQRYPCRVREGEKKGDSTFSEMNYILLFGTNWQNISEFVSRIR